MNSIKNLLFTALMILTISFSVSAGMLDEPLIDDAEMIPSRNHAQVIEALQQLRSKKDIWLVVWTTPSLNGLSIEEVAVKKFEEWKIGQEGKDNGLLLVIAKNERKMRLEVGYGLEGSIPDAKAIQLLDFFLKSSLRDNNLKSGLLNLIANLSNSGPAAIVIPEIRNQRKVPADSYIIVAFFAIPLLIFSFVLAQQIKKQLQQLDLKFRPYEKELVNTKKKMGIQRHVSNKVLPLVFAGFFYVIIGIYHLDPALTAICSVFALVFTVVFAMVVNSRNYYGVKAAILNLSTKDEEELKIIFSINQNQGGGSGGGGGWRSGSWGSYSSSSGSSSSGGGSFSGGGKSGGGGASSGW